VVLCGFAGSNGSPTAEFMTNLTNWLLRDLDRFGTRLLFNRYPVLADAFLRFSDLETWGSHHRWLFVVHGCRLSATELCRLPLPVSDTNLPRQVTSAPFLPVSEAVRSLIFATVPFQTFHSDSVIISDTLIAFATNLLTCLYILLVGIIWVSVF